MEPRERLVTVLGTDYFPPKLKQLCVTASGVFNEHINAHELMPFVGSIWLCERAVLAEHNLRRWEGVTHSR